VRDDEVRKVVDQRLQELGVLELLQGNAGEREVEIEDSGPKEELEPLAILSPHVLHRVVEESMGSAPEEA